MQESFKVTATWYGRSDRPSYLSKLAGRGSGDGVTSVFAEVEIQS